MRKFICTTIVAYGIGSSLLFASWSLVEYAMLVGVVKANGNPDIELRHRLNAVSFGGYFLLANIITLMAAKEL